MIDHSMHTIMDLEDSETTLATLLYSTSDDLRRRILALLSYFLGIAVTRHPNGLFLSQGEYAEEVIERAGMSSGAPAPTPVDTNSKLSASSGSQYKDPKKYHSLAGALQYLTFTRPDISYVVQ